MKKILFLIILSATTVKAQITLENTYANRAEFYFVRLSMSDNKWAAIDSTTITLYNLNHSIYKVIPIVNAPVYAEDVLFISKSLFDTDSNTIEYMVDNIYSSGVHIYREDGTILFSEPTLSAYRSSVILVNPIRPAWFPIVVTASGTKMILVEYDGGLTYDDFKIYSLPGMYYPGSTSGLTLNEEILSLAKPFPNPSANSTTIKFTIPEGERTAEIVFHNVQGSEIKRFMVDSRFNSLVLNTSDLPAGTYFYYITTSNNKSTSQKMVVIK